MAEEGLILFQPAAPQRNDTASKAKMQTEGNEERNSSSILDEIRVHETELFYFIMLSLSPFALLAVKPTNPSIIRIICLQPKKRNIISSSLTSKGLSSLEQFRPAWICIRMRSEHEVGCVPKQSVIKTGAEGAATVLDRGVELVCMRRKRCWGGIFLKGMVGKDECWSNFRKHKWRSLNGLGRKKTRKK